MNYELNDNNQVGPFEYKVKETGFWDNVGNNYKRAKLTDVEYSENIQYGNALENLAKDKQIPEADEVSKMFGFFNTVNPRGLEHFDDLIDNGSIKFDENGKAYGTTRTANLYLRSQRNNIETYNKLKVKGYNSEKLKNIVINHTRKKANELGEEINAYEEEHPVGSIGGSILGAGGAFLTSPTETLGLITEMTILKHGKKFFTEGKNFMSAFTEAEKAAPSGVYSAEEISKKLSDYLIKNKMNVNDLVSISKGYKSSKIAHLSGPAKEKAFFKLIKKGEIEGITPELAKKLKNINNKESLAELSKLAGLSGVTQATAHKVNAEAGFDFKHSVYPQYSKDDLNSEVGFAFGFGALLTGAIGAFVRFKPHKIPEVPLINEVNSNAVGDLTLGQAKKLEFDITNGNAIDIENAHNVINKDKVNEKRLSITDEDIEMTKKDPEFKKVMDDFNKKQQDYDDLMSCLSH